METKNIKNTISIVKNKNIFDCAINRIQSGHNGCTVIIPHVCNNVDAFGAGFAGAVSKFFPDVKTNFHLLGKTARLGHTQFVTAKSDSVYKYQLIFANMIAQNSLINQSNPRPLNYAALVYCMNEVRQYYRKLNSQADSSKIEIHCPKFGSGLAGGDWAFIEDLIKDIWHDCQTYVYIK
jgi:hypothetical protein